MVICVAKGYRQPLPLPYKIVVCVLVRPVVVDRFNVRVMTASLVLIVVKFDVRGPMVQHVPVTVLVMKPPTGVYVISGMLVWHARYRNLKDRVVVTVKLNESILRLLIIG